MNPKLIQFMKISVPTSFFCILLTACAGEGYADDDKLDSKNGAAKKTTVNENNDNLGAKNDAAKKKTVNENKAPAGKAKINTRFSDIIKKEKLSFDNLDNEKSSATQKYNNTKHRPIIISRHNQIVKDKIIYAGKNNNCGLNINGYNNVKISNVTIYHANNGICANNAKSLQVNNLKLVSLSAPTTGPHCPRSSNDGVVTAECWGQRTDPADSRLGILLQNSPNATITGLSTFQASSGVYAVDSPKTKLAKVRCYDMRGPFPRGQCVQFNRSSNSTLTTFYAKNYEDQSHSEDNINAYKSDNVKIRDGLVDGNWSRSGVGVIADVGSNNMLVENVDLMHISNAAVSVYSNDANNIGVNFKAQKIRIKDSQCHSRKSTKPASGGLMLAAHPKSINPVFNDIKWYNHCRDSVHWCLPGQGCRKNNSGKVSNIKEESFITRWTNE